MARLRDKARAALITTARQIDMDDGRDAAVDYLISVDMGGYEGNGRRSAHRILDYATFRYINCVPRSHPLWREWRDAEDAAIKRNQEARRYKDVLLERSRGTCEWCKSPLTPRAAQVDHIDPNGGSELSNLAILCRSCNSRKSNHSLDTLERIETAQAKRAEEMHDWEEQSNCPCEYDGCPPDCSHCSLCREHGLGSIICPFPSEILAEHGWDYGKCANPTACGEARMCLDHEPGRSGQ